MTKRVGALGSVYHVELQAARLIGEAAFGLCGHLLLEFGFLAGLCRQIGEDGPHGFSPWLRGWWPTLARMVTGVSLASRRASHSLPSASRRAAAAAGRCVPKRGGERAGRSDR